MENFLQAPGWAKQWWDKQLKELLESPEMKDILEQAKRDRERAGVQAKEYHKWLAMHKPRYTNVKVTIEHYLRSKQRILPPDFGDFVEWFYDYAKNNNCLTTAVIQDYHFELYHQHRVQVITEKSFRWSPLCNDLVTYKYISESTSLVVFDHVMNFKQLQPECKEKIWWLSSKIAGVYFADQMGFELRQLNYCFRNKDGKPFHSKNRETMAKNPLPDIIKKHKKDFPTQ